MGKTRDMALIGLGAALAPRARTEYHNHRTEVHEHRAPTDESVKLLKEFEEKAREKLLASVPLKANGFESVMFVERDAMSMDFVLTIRAKINGQKIEATVRERAMGTESIREALPKLRDELAKQIAVTILVDSLEKTELPRP